MKYMLLLKQVASGDHDEEMADWTPEDVQAHVQFQLDLRARLVASGELMLAEGLGEAATAHVVVSADGQSAMVTDGLYAESKEVLAGFWIVDVASADRAVSIAAQISAAPGAKGRPLAQPIEVRRLVPAPEPA